MHRSAEIRGIANAFICKAESRKITNAAAGPAGRRGQNGGAVRNCDWSIKWYWIFTGKRTCGTRVRLGNLFIWRAAAGRCRRTAFGRRAGYRDPGRFSDLRRREEILGSGAIPKQKY